MRGLILAVCLLALPVMAQDEEAPILILRMRDCSPPECVIVSYTELMAAVERSNANWERARKAEEALAEVRKGGPKCATLEVVPKRPVIVPNPKTLTKSGWTGV